MANEVEKNNQVPEEVSLREMILKLKDWWDYLWSKKWIIIAVGISGGILGFLYAYSKKPVYTATTTFVLETSEKGGNMGAYAGVASLMGIDLGGGGGGIFQGENIFDLYKSRKMIEMTLFSPVDSISKQPLIETYIEMNELREGWKENKMLKDLKFTINNSADRAKISDPKLVRVRDSVIGKIAQSIITTYLTVGKPDKKLSKIQVDIKAGDEVFAKRFNEELVKNVNDFYVQTKTKKSLENVAILQHKADSVKAVMNGAIVRSVTVLDATPNLNPTRQVIRVAPVQRAQFSAETNKSILSEMIKNLEMSKMTLLKETPLIQVIDEPIYPLFKKKLSKLIALVVGGMLGGILIVLYLVSKRGLRLIMEDETNTDNK